MPNIVSCCSTQTWWKSLQI